MTSNKHSGFVQCQLIMLCVAALVACGGGEPTSLERDEDGDGIVDVLDGCRNQPETVNGYQDSDGCPDVVPQPPPPSPVDSGFTGSWSGPATITAPGQQPLVYTGSVTLAASGSALTASRFCPDGTGAISMTGSGRSVPWSGSYTCAYASAACATTTLTFTSATFVLNNTASMSLTAAGVLAGCGQSFNVTFTLNGSR